MTRPEEHALQASPPAPSPGTSLPNAFIVGAPKSGTTALGTYLHAHPEVFVAAKELSYFATDLEFRTRKGERLRVPWEDYLAWFAGHEDVKYRVDRSVFYLYSEQAAAEIHRFDPSARIVAMLRNPVDQMHAEHSEMRYQGEEDIADFADALAAEADRRRGRRIPAGCKHAFGLYYRDLTRYASQLERYFSVFGRDQVHVVVFDDLRDDPAGTYRGVLEFLGIDVSHRPELTAVNANKEVRSTALLRTLRTTSPGIRGLGRFLVPSAGARARLRRRLHSLNTAERPRRPLPAELRRVLALELEPEVERLEALLGRRLPAWHPQRGG